MLWYTCRIFCGRGWSSHRASRDLAFGFLKPRIMYWYLWINQNWKIKGAQSQARSCTERQLRFIIIQRVTNRCKSKRKEKRNVWSDAFSASQPVFPALVDRFSLLYPFKLATVLNSWKNRTGQSSSMTCYIRLTCHSPSKSSVASWTASLAGRI